MANTSTHKLNTQSDPAGRLIEQLTLHLDKNRHKQGGGDPSKGKEAEIINTSKQILSAIKDFVPTINPDNPIFAGFHNGQVQHPLGGGSYAFQDDIVGPILSSLVDDEEVLGGRRHLWSLKSDTTTTTTTSRPPLPTRPIVIHAGLQPNNSPHAGTLVVFCYAFSCARRLRERMEKIAAKEGGKSPPEVTVKITFVDTAPVDGKGVTVDGVQYQRAYRVAGPSDFTDDYDAVLRFLSSWSGITYTSAFQSDFFSGPSIPKILKYMVSQHAKLGRQLSPKHGVLALRAACPVDGCGLAEKHGRLNTYDKKKSTITFTCPSHGPHSIRVSKAAEAARIEANAPTRNLIRSMSHLLDAKAHNIRVTGGDYAGTYQEVFLYRPLAEWSATRRLAVGKTPHILYAPVILDWSGAKLSKSLYVREGAYDLMRLLGTDGLCSFARLRDHFGDDGSEGLRRIWLEVESWVESPKKLFRSYSVDYMQRVIFESDHQQTTLK